MIESALRTAHAVLNHDFCPWANRWVHWMKQPLACLAAAALVATCCGLFVNPVGFVILGAIAVTGAVGTVWPWFAVRGLSVDAQFLQTRCRVGQSVLVRLQITNRMPWPAWGLFLRQGFHGLPRNVEAGLALARVSGWSIVEYEWLFTPPQRGVYPLGEARLDTGFPFGLWHATVPVHLQNQLIVWPRSVNLDAMPDMVVIQTREDQLTDRRSGSCGDMVGVRPYREGDSLRRVHWQQTARTGRLIVIERQAPATCAFRLVAEVGQSCHRVELQNSSLEQTLSVVASVLESLHRQHALLELEIHDQLLVVGPSAGDLRRALDLLARVPASGVVDDRVWDVDASSWCFSTIAVTTTVGLADPRRQHPVRRGERLIVIRTTDQENAASATGIGHYPAWIELSSTDDLVKVLPERWRRACHGA